MNNSSQDLLQPYDSLMVVSYPLLVQETIIALRGSLSQEQLNRKLGFQTNQIARWESGHAKVSWRLFIQLCNAVKAPLKDSLKLHLFYDQDIDDVKKLLSHLCNGLTRKTLASRLNLSTSQLSRILNGQSPLSVQTLFSLIEFGPYSLVDFVGHLTSANTPACIQKEKNRIAREKEIHFSKPWAAAIILLIMTNEYRSLKKHSDKFFAKKLSVPEAEVKTALRELEEIGVVSLQKNLYHTDGRHLSTGGSFTDAIRVRDYWIKKAQEKLIASKPDGKNKFFGYKIFTLDAETKKALEDFYFRMNTELDLILKKKPQENILGVHLFSFQMFNVDSSE